MKTKCYLIFNADAEACKRRCAVLRDSMPSGYDDVEMVGFYHRERPDVDIPIYKRNPGAWSMFASQVDKETTDKDVVLIMDYDNTGGFVDDFAYYDALARHFGDSAVVITRLPQEFFDDHGFQYGLDRVTDLAHHGHVLIPGSAPVFNFNGLSPRVHRYNSSSEGLMELLEEIDGSGFELPMNLSDEFEPEDAGVLV